MNDIERIIAREHRRIDELSNPDIWVRYTKNMECGELKDFVQSLRDSETIVAALRRTAEDDKAREEGRLVVVPCKVGDHVFTMRWSIQNKKYEVFAGKVKNVVYDAIDGSVMVSDGGCYRKWGKDAFSSRQEAEAALDGGGEGEN